MRFQISNIGGIAEADIALEGITIIAGENNVGKSTVGKSLYAFLHDMNLWKKTYDNICSSKIADYLYNHSTALEDWCMKTSGAKRRRTSKVDQLQKEIAHSEAFVVAIEDFQIDEKNIEEINEQLRLYCKNYIRLYDNSGKDQLYDQGRQWCEQWVRFTAQDIKTLELDELKLQTQQVSQSFQTVFNYQYKKIDTSNCSARFTDDDDRCVEFSSTLNCETLNQPIRVASRIFFIESPKIYDYLSDTRYGHVQKEYARYLMSPNIFKNREMTPKIEKDSISDGYRFNKVLDIARKLERVMGGRAEFFQKVGLEFRDEHISEPIHSVNVSTGLKSMALLEYALRIGAIEYGDVLVLDEPEINLHPEWQVYYAETLVKLQKEFHLKIVITTHSPYFMRAIECYTDIEGTMNQLNVYKVDKDRDKVVVQNVSYSEYGITELYDDLSAPLDDLEELLSEKYGEAEEENGKRTE